MPSIDLSKFTLAILAGGKGSRMGKPKGELTVHGKPILTYLLDRFQWPGPTLLVTAKGRENSPGYESFTQQAIDPVAGQGPLRGVLTALEATPTLFTLITTVDMPEIGTEQLQWLIQNVSRHGDALGMLMERPGNPPQIEPFPSIFHRDAAGVIGSQLETGRFSVHSLAQSPYFFLAPVPVDWPEEVWTNLNRPEDLLKWQRNSQKKNCNNPDQSV